MPKISCILTGHNEGYLIKSSLKSAQNNIYDTELEFCKTEIVVVLDKPSNDTLVALNSSDLTGVVVEIVDFGDPSKSRNHGVNISSGEYIAFLDGDDIFGQRWISSALRTSLNSNNKHIVHPEFNFYFSIDGKIESPIVMRHTSSIDNKFDKFKLASQNLWTVLSFGPRYIYEETPFLANDKDLGLGFEDWTFNVELLYKGIEHLVAPRTLHFIREKKFSSVKREQAKRVSTFMPSDIWFN